MNLNNKKKINVIYLYKKGRKKRLENKINTPSEFFYGYKELLDERKFNIKVYEELDLGLEVKNIFLKKSFNFLSKVIFNFPFNPLLGFMINKSLIKQII